MLRSMFSGVSGLNAHMDKMDVIGNNISNVNTTGFKGSRATFKSMMSQRMQGASAPQDERGGTNPQEVGLGTQLGSIDKDMGQGSLQSTGRNTDLAVEGNGFFMVDDGTERYYTRAGAMDFDSDGYLVNNNNGYRLQGWEADADGAIDTNADLDDISLKQSMDANATSRVNFDGNLNKDVDVFDDGAGSVEDILNGDDDDLKRDLAEISRSINSQVYDSQGGRHNLDLRFVKTDVGEEETTWNVYGRIDDGDFVELNENDPIIFDQSGNVDEGDSIDIGVADLDELDIDGVEDLEFTLDFSNMTQQANDFTADVDTVNGYTSGDLQSFTIDGSGEITGSYDNGRSQTLGRLGLATFNNPSGLSEEGDTLYRVSNNSGPANIGTPGSGGFGEISAGTLEMSNVDLSREFTELISTQRGFQSNSKTITTSDEILQELVNLKR
ncbi:flagellar basal-body rod protein FlgF [Natroniella sulfidigena]|uniref:flagellar basal-body rod protein FlgF n=1 Tax=Natroniella sulfidigena TaxID=723921 RepID=UPI00200A7AC6|nr:flagellar basal-body rod protein FlgF [Natroniella sulfidigena]MCK8816525.1 flagellar basal-body rod protein FlgF [Natroniella sulfidigena]